MWLRVAIEGSGVMQAGCRLNLLSLCVCRLDEIIVFRQLTKGEVKEIADIMLREVFARAEIKGIKIDVTERFKVRGPLLVLSTTECTALDMVWFGMAP
jgi:hypothetical protein